MQARAINTLTFVLALGGLVSLKTSLLTLIEGDTQYHIAPASPQASRNVERPRAHAHAHNDLLQVVLVAILYESHAWRQTVWHVVDEAVVVESKVRLPPSCCSLLMVVPQLQPSNSSSHFALPCAGMARPHEGLHRSLPEVASGRCLTEAPGWWLRAERTGDSCESDHVHHSCQ